MKRSTTVLGMAACCLLLAGSAGIGRDAQKAPSGSAVPRSLSGIKSDSEFGKMPLYFIPNDGQIDEPVAFYVQGKDKTLYFTPEGVTIALTASAQPGAERWVVKLDFVGANKNVKPAGEAETGAAVSYFRGKPEEWRTGIPAYSRIVYPNLWPGIDLVYYGTVNKLKYEFVVHPGADPSKIRLAYRGAESVSVEPDGRLQVATPVGGFEDDVPVAYQEKNGKRVCVELAYELQGNAGDGSGNPARDGADAQSTRAAVAYGFKTGDYDANLPLVIDPAILIYCGYIGGTGYDTGQWIAVDASGNAYVTGSANSIQTTFPVTTGPDLTHNGSSDIFVAKVNSAGTALVYCGYIGGSSAESGFGIAVDGSGNAYLTGYTESTQSTFPVMVGPDVTHNVGQDVFVAKVNATGTALVYCGYIGGWMQDIGYGIAVDSSGNAYVAGQTESNETTLPFPVTVGPDLTFNGAFGDNDGFVAKVNAAGTALVYCGYIGGSATEACLDISVDGSGNAYLTGYTNSTQATFPVAVGPDLTHNGGGNGFVAKVNSAGTALAYCGYIGSGGASGIAVDAGGNAYITGETYTTQTTFPVTLGPDLTHNGQRDVYVAKVNAAGTGFDYCGYIGGSSDDSGMGIAVDAAGNAYVTGETRSTETTFPVKAGPDLTFNGGAADSFIAKINPAGTALIYCGYLGGSDEDHCRAVAVDGAGNAFVTGYTASSQTTFPVSVGPELTFDGGIYDAFVAKVYYFEQPVNKHAVGDFDGDSWDEVAMDFGSSGAWMWDNSVWTQIDTRNPENLVAANVDGNTDDEILLDFGAAGLWLWDGGALTQTSGVNVDCLAAGDTDADGSDEVAADFGASGLWYWNGGSWTQLSGANLEYLAVANLDGTGGAEIIGDFGAIGLWVWSGGGWTQLSGVNADRFTSGNTDGAGGEDLIGDFGPTGLWLFSSGAWTQLSGVNADNTITADIDHSGDKEIIGDFAATGLWLWDSGTWTQLSGVNADDTIAADVDGDGAEEVMGDFAALGLWLWNGGVWSQISGVNPEGFLAADVDGDGAKELIADFGSLGVWKWDAGAWAQISANNPD
ncbi:MAG: hypothetical protein A2W03_08925 [Candidatus Aminicenantes bacterium RBG_16_63_16]|nr:MAG: hypothetical protein A2W03_08925 [Candidatus Aminicenantes bacterium RBG_16_63_16]